MQANLNIVKEFQYVTGTYPELDMVLSKGNIDRWFAFNYTYTVYLEFCGKKEIVYFSQSTDKYPVTERRFVDYLTSLPVNNLHDLIYLTTLYRKTGTENNLFIRYNGRVRFLENYLTNTYGRLVYTCQAIYLLMFYSNFSYDLSKRIIFGLNDREIDAQARVFTLTIEEGYSFFDLWNEYTFGKRVYQPKFEIANKLKLALL